MNYQASYVHHPAFLQSAAIWGLPTSFLSPAAFCTLGDPPLTPGTHTASLGYTIQLLFCRYTTYYLCLLRDISSWGSASAGGAFSSSSQRIGSFVFSGNSFTVPVFSNRGCRVIFLLFFTSRNTRLPHSFWNSQLPLPTSLWSLWIIQMAAFCICNGPNSPQTRDTSQKAFKVHCKSETHLPRTNLIITASVTQPELELANKDI